jgi:hypothetical protein
MGLADFFSSLSGKPTPAKIEKIMKRMLNEHHQPQVRQESMEELAGIGTPLAIEAPDPAPGRELQGHDHQRAGAPLGGGHPGRAVR